MAKKRNKKDALDYHEFPIPGKIQVVPTKQTKTQRDLALAYSPGVAEPCLEIAKNVEKVYNYTAKGNLVAVISDGTAVLGLGDIGPEASKPVMEGKGLLFKIFAGIDVFDLEVNTQGIDEFVQVVKSLEPTFGGINLEDISAPEAFEIEEQLKEALNIPIMHDDQHGTAIIVGAALLNALEVVGKKIKDVKFCVSGAGASALSTINIICQLGAKKENFLVIDSKGVITTNRKNLDKYKKRVATDITTFKTLRQAINNADVFIGLSRGGLVKGDMIKTMAKNPIVFALANPDPEILPDEALKARKDVLMATGRSDFPNQVNNVLGFPFIFRGALDVRATEINEAMKLAAVKALADLTRKPVPHIVNIAYNDSSLSFGPEYLIPKPLDPRLLTTVAPAVAKAAMDSGVAQKPITDWIQYERDLISRLGQDDNIIRLLVNKAKSNLQRIVFAEADKYRILKAAEIVMEEGIAQPILLGNERRIKKLAKEQEINLKGVEILDIFHEKNSELREEYLKAFFEKRQRRGYNFFEARKIMRDWNYFGAMMVDRGSADAMVSGLTRKYPDMIKPALEIIGTMEKGKKVAGLYLLLTSRGPLFLADATMIVNPSTQELVDITLMTTQMVKQFNIVPKVAMLSYSNFGSSEGEEPNKVRKAVEIIQKKFPKMIIDGEMQANFAMNNELLKESFPFSKLVDNQANVLIFPSLSAGNIAYKMIQSMGAAEAIGPILMGLKKSVQILQVGSSVREIVNMATIASVEAQMKNEVMKK